jgi:uridine kinase
VPATPGGRPLVVGVAGGSGAGKSTVVRRLKEALGENTVAVIPHDAYYRDRSHLTPEERDRINYDHPDALETELLVQHVSRLLEGYPVTVPSYDFARHVRRPGGSVTEPRPVLVLDGIMVLAEPRVRELLDLKIFVDTADQDRLGRRLRRDVERRGRSPDHVLAQYRATVEPMHRRFVAPSRTFADLVIRHGGHDPAGIRNLVDRVQDLIERRGRPPPDG